MAVYDLQEQEQLDDVKAWWGRYGNSISTVVLVLALGVLGWQGWKWYSAGRAEAASTLYAAVADAQRTGNADKAKDAMAQLLDRYSGTSYAPRAAVVYARMLWDKGDKAGARAQLSWVLEHASDAELAQVARFRLAETWLDEGKSDEALKLLDAKTDDAFVGIYADLRGDALAAAGRKEEARKAYETALAKIDSRSPYRSYIEVKYQTMGGAAAAPAGTISLAPAAAPAPNAPAQATPPAPAAAAPANTPAPATPAPAKAGGAK